MAKIRCFNGTPPPSPLHSQWRRHDRVIQSFFSNSNTNAPPKSNRRNISYNRGKLSENESERETPRILKIAVSGVTELLRLFSPSSHQIQTSVENQRDESQASSVDDVLRIIESDYHNAYFVTGNFTSSIYAHNCVFEDPTIKFRGRELYARNLKLLVPFFDCASIRLLKIDKVADSDTKFVLATWKLRTNLKLPWRPLISIDGSTFYELNEDFKIIRHVESWNVSALEAILQIFTFKFENKGS